MEARIAVPYNLLETRRGLVGADAHFWRSVEIKPRIVLLLRPARQLQDRPLPGYKMLKPLIGVEEQVRDLESLPSLLDYAKKHFRWKLARLLYPARDPGGGWEYSLARSIVGELLPVRPRHEVAWLNLVVREGRILVGGREDSSYGWLASNDRGVLLALSRIARLQ